MRLKAWMTGLVLLLLCAGEGLGASPVAIPPLDPSRSTCESDIFLYVDESGSVGPGERAYIVRALGGALVSSEVDNIASDREVTVLPFGADVKKGKEQKLEKTTDQEIMENKLRDALISASKSGIDKSQSNIISVLRNISERIAALGKAGSSNAVFIIASDFEHDQTKEEGDASRDKDETGWEDFTKERVWQDLQQEFDDSEAGGPFLFLLPTVALSDFAKTVIGDLDTLTPAYKSDLGPTGEGFDSTGIMRFLDPVRISSRYEKRLDGGYLISTARVRSCIKMIKVRLVAYTYDQDDPQVEPVEAADASFKEVRPGQEPPPEWVFRFEKTERKRDLNRMLR